MPEEISLDAPGWRIRFRTWKMIQLQNFKYKWHYWFGRTLIKDQWGWFNPLFDPSDEQETQKLLKQAMANLCWRLKIEPLGRAKWNKITPNPSSEDPLAHRGLISIKLNGQLHTRKSWPVYVQRLIEAKL